MEKAIVGCALVTLCAMLVVSCKTAQSTVKKTDNKTVETTTNTANAEILRKVTANAQSEQFLTSKIKFRVQFGDKDVLLGGRLYMKRNDVIRLQLTALGLFEAARVEFTNDYVLVMDRMNKQYIKVAYSDVDFLRQSGLNFNSLQSLFWNELFLPGHTDRVSSADVKNYDISTGETGILTLKLDNGKLHYKWTANKQNGRISNFYGSYAEQGTNVGMDWNYDAFKAFGSKQFPTSNKIKVTAPKRTVNVDLQLSNINNDNDWETRTSVSSKYKQVKLDDIMRKLSSM